MYEETLRVDEKGRVAIPARIRRFLGIKNAVRAKLDNGVLTLEPIEDPLQSLEKLTLKGTSDVQKEIRKLRRAAETELGRGSDSGPDPTPTKPD